MQQARQDLERLRAGGITEYQIDSVFDSWLLNTTTD